MHDFQAHAGRLFVIGSSNAPMISTPVFRMSDGSETEAVAAFTNEGLAAEHVEQCGEPGDTVVTVDNAALIKWVSAIRDNGVTWLAVDPSCEDVLNGCPTNLIAVEGLLAMVGAQLSSEIAAMGLAGECYSRYRCPECGRAVRALSGTETPLCHGQPMKAQKRPVLPNASSQLHC